MMNTNDEKLTAEEIALTEATESGKQETLCKQLLIAFGGTACTSPTQNGKLCVRFKDIEGNCQAVGDNKYTAMDALAAALVLLRQVVPDSSDKMKEFLLEMLHDLVLGDDEDRDEIVGYMIGKAFKLKFPRTYKTVIQWGEK